MAARFDTAAAGSTGQHAPVGGVPVKPEIVLPADTRATVERCRPSGGSGVVREQGEMAGAPQRAQEAERPLVEGEDRGGAVAVGEDHVRYVGDAEIVAVVALFVDDCQRGRVIGGGPFGEVVSLAGNVRGAPLRSAPHRHVARNATNRDSNYSA
jgi:hypothetical protein